MILSYWRAILVVKIVSGMKKLPAVELCHGTCPLGQQSEAPKTHFHQQFVVSIRSWDARIRSERGGHLRTIPDSDKDVKKVLFCVCYLESSQAYLMWSSRILCILSYRLRVASWMKSFTKGCSLFSCLSTISSARFWVYSRSSWM